MNKPTLFVTIFIMGIITATINSANAQLADHVGLFESVLFIHCVGSVVSILYYLLLEKNKNQSLLNVIKTKPYKILGGFIGSAAVVSISFAVQNASVLVVSTALIAGQFILSFIIDWQGWFGFEKLDMSKRKLVSIMIMLAGVALISM